MQETCGGSFVVIDEDLYEELDAFKKKLYSYVDKSFSIVKAQELLHVWCTSCRITLKSLHLLGSTYFLMSPLHLDAFCQWVISKRKVFTCKENFDINLLMEHEEQSSHLMNVIVDQVDNESETTIKYWPVCEDWQKRKCQMLGMKFVRGNISHVPEPCAFSTFHQPAVTGRILGDGNCFFRALAHVVTGSQEDHYELRAITTSYMQHNAEDLSCYLEANDCMEDYLVRSDMQSPSVWATEKEIFAAAYMLATPIFVFSKCGHRYTSGCNSLLSLKISVPLNTPKRLFTLLTFQTTMRLLGVCSIFSIVYSP